MCVSIYNTKMETSECIPLLFRIQKDTVLESVFVCVCAELTNLKR